MTSGGGATGGRVQWQRAARRRGDGVGTEAAAGSVPAGAGARAPAGRGGHLGFRCLELHPASLPHHLAGGVSAETAAAASPLELAQARQQAEVACRASGKRSCSHTRTPFIKRQALPNSTGRTAWLVLAVHSISRANRGMQNLESVAHLQQEALVGGHAHSGRGLQQEAACRADHSHTEGLCALQQQAAVGRSVLRVVMFHCC